MTERLGHTFVQVSHVASRNAMARAFAAANDGSSLSFAAPHPANNPERHSLTSRMHLACFRLRNHSPSSNSAAVAMSHSPEVIRPSGEAKHATRAIGESFAVAPSKVVNGRTLTAPRGAIDASVNIASQGSRATHGRATAYRRFVGEGV